MAFVPAVRGAAVSLEEDGTDAVKDLTQDLNGEDLGLLFPGSADGVADHRAQTADIADDDILHRSIPFSRSASGAVPSNRCSGGFVGAARKSHCVAVKQALRMQLSVLISLPDLGGPRRLLLS